MNINQLAGIVRDVNADNGWDIYRDGDFTNNPDKVMRILCLIHSEVSEAAEAVRHGDVDNFLEELADTLIRVLDCAGGFGVNFDALVRAKIEKNRGRGYKHGGKRL